MRLFVFVSVPVRAKSRSREVCPRRSRRPGRRRCRDRRVSRAVSEARWVALRTARTGAPAETARFRRVTYCTGPRIVRLSARRRKPFRPQAIGIRDRIPDASVPVSNTRPARTRPHAHAPAGGYCCFATLCRRQSVTALCTYCYRVVNSTRVCPDHKNSKIKPYCTLCAVVVLLKHESISSKYRL